MGKFSYFHWQASDAEHRLVFEGPGDGKQKQAAAEVPDDESETDSGNETTDGRSLEDLTQDAKERQKKVEQNRIIDAQESQEGAEAVEKKIEGQPDSDGDGVDDAEEATTTDKPKEGDENTIEIEGKNINEIVQEIGQKIVDMLNNIFEKFWEMVKMFQKLINGEKIDADPRKRLAGVEKDIEAKKKELAALEGKDDLSEEERLKIGELQREIKFLDGQKALAQEEIAKLEAEEAKQKENAEGGQTEVANEGAEDTDEAAIAAAQKYAGENHIDVGSEKPTVLEQGEDGFEEAKEVIVKQNPALEGSEQIERIVQFENPSGDDDSDGIGVALDADDKPLGVTS